MPLVRLTCPRCDAALPAPPDTLLFACPACGRTSALAGGRLVPVAAAVAAPRLPAAGADPARYPCWLFPVTWDEAAAAPPAPAGPPAWLPPARIAVPSLAPETGGAYLRLARALSLQAGGLVTTDDPPAVAVGGQVGVAEATRLVETVALACVPGLARRRLLELDAPALRAGPPSLLWLPCARAAGRLRDLVAGVEVTDRLLGAVPPASGAADDRRAGRDAAPPPSRGNGAVDPRAPDEPAAVARER